jgi:hypothetical protein
LFNIVNGYRKKEDYLSRERWEIGRKVMFAYLSKYLGEHGKETDILTFPWEKNHIKKLTEEELLQAIQDEEESKAFWATWDKRKQGIT